MLNNTIYNNNNGIISINYHDIIMERYRKYTQLQLNIELLNETKSGNLENVQYLLLSPELPEHAQLIIYKEKKKAKRITKPFTINKKVPKEDNDGESPAFISACEHGHLDIVKFFMTCASLEERVSASIENGEGFKKACYKKHFHIVEYLLTDSKIEPLLLSQYKHIIYDNIKNNNNELIFFLLQHPTIKNTFDIHEDKDNALFIACASSNMTMIDFLLTSPDLPENSNINAVSSNGQTPLICACRSGDINIVKMLLTNNKLKEKADIHAINDYAIAIACAEGHIEIVKYLLTSDELIEKANIHAYSDDDAFIQAVKKKQLPVIDFLIKDYEIEKTTYISTFLNNYINNPKYSPMIEEIDRLLTITKLKHSLEKELNHHNSPTKTGKRIKI